MPCFCGSTARKAKKVARNPLPASESPTKETIASATPPKTGQELISEPWSPKSYRLGGSSNYLPGEAQTMATTASECLLEMTCDMLCARTMTVSYTDGNGARIQSSVSGFNQKMFLPVGCSDINVSFVAVGGLPVFKVDRSDPTAPWVRNDQGQLIPEAFFYKFPPAQHVQYTIKGPSFRSWVHDVDERNSEECLFELVRRDPSCPSTMQISYKDADGEQYEWAGTGYNVKCHLPFSVREIEVTFSTFGRPFNRVNRREPGCPWVVDGDGNYPPERFVYSRCPVSVRYESRGGVMNPYISRVDQQVYDPSEDEVPQLLVSDDPPELFAAPAQQVPPIGGVGLVEPHSEFLLPAEVTLYEPPASEIFHHGARQIYNNTPLTEEETEQLRAFHKFIATTDIGDSLGNFPRCTEIHALRYLVKAKFDPHKAVDLMKLAMRDRIVRLPVSESDVLEDLKAGGIYWHGRDKQCRPCLIVRVERLGSHVKNRERTLRLIVFLFEYALRYLMVPGRVENWVVIIDVANASSAISTSMWISVAIVAQAIATMLEKVYCGRMAWIKIINLSNSAYLIKIVNGLIPADKKHKVSFPMNIAEDVRKLFEPNQVEERYGGTAPTLQPEETYPFKFFLNCRGTLDDRDESPGVSISPRPRHFTNDIDSEQFSLHQCTTLEFHQGQLWDESSIVTKERWMEEACASSLTPASAKYISELACRNVRPCRDIKSWLRIVRPQAARGMGTDETVCSQLHTQDTPRSSRIRPRANSHSPMGRGKSNSPRRSMSKEVTKPIRLKTPITRWTLPDDRIVVNNLTISV